MTNPPKPQSFAESISKAADDHWMATPTNEDNYYSADQMVESFTAGANFALHSSLVKRMAEVIAQSCNGTVLEYDDPRCKCKYCGARIAYQAALKDIGGE